MSPSPSSNAAAPPAWRNDGWLARTVWRRHAWPSAVGRGFLGDGLASGFAAVHARHMGFIDRMLGQHSAPHSSEGTRLPVVRAQRTTLARSAAAQGLVAALSASNGDDDGAASADIVVADDAPSGAQAGDAAPVTAHGGVAQSAVSRSAVARDAVSHDAISQDAHSRDASSRDALSPDASSRDTLLADAATRNVVARDGISRSAISRGAVLRDQATRDALPRDALSRGVLSRAAAPAVPTDAPGAADDAMAAAVDEAAAAPVHAVVPTLASPASLPTVRVMSSARALHATIVARPAAPLSRSFAAPDSAANPSALREPAAPDRSSAPGDVRAGAAPFVDVVAPPLTTARVPADAAGASGDTVTAQRAPVDPASASGADDAADAGSGGAAMDRAADATTRPLAGAGARPEGTAAELRSPASAAADAAPLPVRSATVQRRPAVGAAGGLFAASDPGVIARSPQPQRRHGAAVEPAAAAAAAVLALEPAAAAPASPPAGGTADAPARQHLPAGGAMHAIDRAGAAPHTMMRTAAAAPAGRAHAIGRAADSDAAMPAAGSPTLQAAPAVAGHAAATPVALTLQRAPARSAATPAAAVSAPGMEAAAPVALAISGQAASAPPPPPSSGSDGTSATAADPASHDGLPMVLKSPPQAAAIGAAIAPLQADAAEPPLLRAHPSAHPAAGARAAAASRAGSGATLAPAMPLPGVQPDSSARRAAPPSIAMPVVVPANLVHRTIDTDTPAVASTQPGDATATDATDAQPLSRSAGHALQRAEPPPALPIVVAARDALAAPPPTHVLMRSPSRVPAALRSAAVTAMADFADIASGAPTATSVQRSIDSLPAPGERFSAAPAAPTEANTTPSVPTPAAAAPAAAGVDLDELVDRALQALMQRLDIERERRGFTRWA